MPSQFSIRGEVSESLVEIRVPAIPALSMTRETPVYLRALEILSLAGHMSWYKLQPQFNSVNIVTSASKEKILQLLSPQILKPETWMFNSWFSPSGPVLGEIEEFAANPLLYVRNFDEHVQVASGRRLQMHVLIEYEWDK